MTNVGATPGPILISLWRKYCTGMRIILPSRNALVRVGLVDLRITKELTVVLALLVSVSTVTTVYGISHLLYDHDKATASVVPAPEIGTAQVILAPSDGHEGQPLALLGGRPLFPIPPGIISANPGTPFEAQGVVVQQATEQGFWIGPTADQRIYVFAGAVASITDSLSPQALRIGEPVNVSGRLSELSEIPVKLGVTDAAAADLLHQQGAYIKANSIRPVVTVSS